MLYTTPSHPWSRISRSAWSRCALPPRRVGPTAEWWTSRPCPRPRQRSRTAETPAERAAASSTTIHVTLGSSPSASTQLSSLTSWSACGKVIVISSSLVVGGWRSWPVWSKAGWSGAAGGRSGAKAVQMSESEMFTPTTSLGRLGHSLAAAGHSCKRLPPPQTELAMNDCRSFSLTDLTTSRCCHWARAGAKSHDDSSMRALGSPATASCRSAFAHMKGWGRAPLARWWAGIASRTRGTCPQPCMTPHRGSAWLVVSRSAAGGEPPCG